MEEVYESISKCLPLSFSNETPQSPKTLLDLPDDVLLPILAKVPFESFAPPNLRLEPLQRLRLVCKRFNEITRAKAYYHGAAQANFSSASALFFFESSEVNLRNTIALHHENTHLYLSIMSWISDDPPVTLRSVILLGVQLLVWLCQHAERPGSQTSIFGVLRDMIKREQLDLAGILAIRIAIIYIFEGITSSLHADVIDFAGCHIDLWTKSEEEVQATLFLAFESALLGLFRNDQCSTRHRNHVYIKVVFVAMLDPSAFLASGLRRNHDRAPFLRTVPVFTAVIKYMALDDEKFGKLLGSGLETLSDIELHRRVTDVMKQEDFSQEVLGNVNLVKIGRSLPLTQHVLPMKPLWYRD